MKSKIRVLKALGDETRLRIACLLMKSKSLCVCELEDAVKIKQSSISKALKVLKDADVINDERRAQWKYYSLNRNSHNPGFRIVKAIIEEIENTVTAKKDTINLKIRAKNNCKRR
jgi:ArsR family transcriptional regulator